MFTETLHIHRAEGSGAKQRGSAWGFCTLVLACHDVTMTGKRGGHKMPSLDKLRKGGDGKP